MIPRATLATTDTVQKLGFAVLLAYLFLLYSRTMELVALLAHHDLYLVLIFGTLAVIFCFLNGGFFRALRSRPGIYLLFFTAWLVIDTPMSFWRGGTIEFLQQYWMKSLITFVVAAGLITTLQQCKQAMYAIAWGLILVEFTTFFLGSLMGGRLALASGSLGNANDFAFHINVILPFLFLLLIHGKTPLRIVAGLGLLYGAVSVLKTGSRGGVIVLVVLMLIVFLRLSMLRKVIFLIVAVALIAGGLSTVSQDVMERYKTIFSTKSDNSAEYRSAEASTETRTFNLIKSLEMTFRHPIFGVGPGVFTAALADESKKSGLPPNWRNTHNGYTQISSETGIPGFLFYMAALATCLKSAFSVYRAARRNPEMRLTADMAFCLLLALVAFAVNSAFNNDGYLYYFPVLAGISVALLSASKQAALTASSATSGMPRRTPPSPGPSLPPASAGPGFRGNSTAARLRNQARVKRTKILERR